MNASTLNFYRSLGEQSAQAMNASDYGAVSRVWEALDPALKVESPSSRKKAMRAYHEGYAAQRNKTGLL